MPWMALVTFQPACHSSILCLELPNSPPPLLAESTLWERTGAPGPSPGAPSPPALFRLDSSVSCGLRPYLAKCSASSLLLRHESGRAERTDIHAEPIAGMIDGNAVLRRLKSCAIFLLFLLSPLALLVCLFVSFLSLSFFLSFAFFVSLYGRFALNSIWFDMVKLDRNWLITVKVNFLVNKIRGSFPRLLFLLSRKVYAEFDWIWSILIKLKGSNESQPTTNWLPSIWIFQSRQLEWNAEAATELIFSSLFEASKFDPQIQFREFSFE